MQDSKIAAEAIGFVAAALENLNRFAISLRRRAASGRQRPRRTFGSTRMAGRSRSTSRARLLRRAVSWPSGQLRYHSSLTTGS